MATSTAVQGDNSKGDVRMIVVQTKETAWVREARGRDRWRLIVEGYILEWMDKPL